jgi:hypothetical protein
VVGFSWGAGIGPLPIGFSTYPTTVKRRHFVKSFANYRSILFIGIGITLSSASTSFSQDIGHRKTAPSEYKASVEGLVRDVSCPIQNHKSTAIDFNLECAIACAKSGSPLVILTKNGDIYFPISDEMPDASQREKLMPFVGKYVRVSGTVFERNGTRAIAIKDINELKNVKLNPKAGGI